MATKNTYRNKLQQALVSLIIALSGLLYIGYTWTQIEKEAFKNVLLISKSIEASLPKDVLKKLSGNPNDVEKPEYRLIKNILIDIIEINKEARFAYLYTLKNDKIIFIADSEPEDSKDYSPPGQEYTEATIYNKQPFKDGKAFVTLPYTDRWGTWESALIPIVDRATGKTIAVFALDVSSNRWNYFISYHVLESTFLAILLFGLVFFLFKVKRNNNFLKGEISLRKEFEKENRLLANAMKSINDCVSITDLENNIIFVNETFLKTYNYTKDELVGRDMALVHSPNNNPEVVAEILPQTLTGGWEGELLNISKDGSEFNIHLSTSTIFDEDSNAIALIGVAYDITKRIKDEELLRQSETRFKLVSNATKDVIWERNLITNKNWRSDNFQTIFGWTNNPAEYSDNETQSRVHPDDRQRVVEKIFRFFSSNDESWEDEYRFQRKDGSYAWVLDRAVLLRDKSGTPIRAVGAMVDQTDRKEKQEELRQSEEKYRNMFEDNPQPMWIYDAETLAFLEVNHAAVNHYGYSKEEFISMTIKDIRPIEDIPRLLEDIKNTKTTHHIAGQWRHRKKNGEIIFVEIILHSVVFNGRNARHALINDISDRKKVEADLNFSKEVLITTNKELERSITNIMAIHKAGQHLQLLKEPETLAREVISLLETVLSYEFVAVLLFAENDDNLIPFAISSQGKGNTFVENDKSFIKSHNTRLGVGIVGWVAQHGESLRLGDVSKDSRYCALRQDIHSELCVPLKLNGKVIGVINIETSKPNAFSEVDQLVLETIASQIAISIQNSTMFKQSQDSLVELQRQIIVRKQIECDLILAKEKAEESDGLKTAFLHNISHEVRTPMNAIIGFAGFLSNPDLLPEKHKYFTSIIVNNCNKLLSIVTDIISIATIDAGQEIVDEREFELNSTLRILYEELLLKNRNQGVGLFFNPDRPSNEVYIKTDESKIVQILTRLIDNALIYTNKGYVNFGYRLKTNELNFFVEDTGIGIPNELLKEIFKRFRQVETTETRQFGGSGLGLSISKGYVELLGGEIWVESELGKGSTFYFTIPCKTDITHSSPKNYAVETMQQGSNMIKNILIVEDEEVNSMLLKEFLSTLNVNIFYALNGLEAVNRCKSEPHIDLVLMDVKMPIMDGYEATKLIREFMPDVPIVAQTAYASQMDRDMAIEYGFSDFITKPFSRKLIISKITEYLQI